MQRAAWRALSELLQSLHKGIKFKIVRWLFQNERTNLLQPSLWTDEEQH